VYVIEPKAGKNTSISARKGGVVLFGDTVGMVDKHLVIECPTSIPLYYEMQNSEVKPRLSEENGLRTYTGAFHDCAPIHLENRSVSLANIVPRLLWTTFPDWEALGTYASDVFWSKVDSSASAVDGYIQGTSHEIRGVPALMNATLWTLVNVRNVDLPLDLTGYVPNSADWVWKTRYGSSVDKSIFLTAVLRAYGFTPMPVLVPFDDVPFSRLPVLEQFKHVILAVPNGEDTLWLDPSAEFYAPGSLPHACTYGQGCMLVAGVPLLAPVPQVGDTEATRTEIRVTVDSIGNGSGFAECIPHGEQAADASRLLTAIDNNQRRSFAERAIHRIDTAATVEDLDLSNVSDLTAPVTLRVTFTCPHLAKLDSGRIIFEIPANPFEFAECEFDTSSRNTYPVEIACHGRIRTEWGITFPEGYRLLASPPPLIIENPYIHLELSLRILSHGVEWVKTIDVKADHVPAVDYPSVCSAIKASQSPQNCRIVLVPQPPAKLRHARKTHGRN